MKNKLMFDLIGFDFDGTLVNSAPAIENAIIETAKKFNFSLKNIDIDYLSSLPLNDYRPHLGIDEIKFDKFKNCFKTVFDKESFRLVKKQPGVDQLFETLAEKGLGKRTFLLTNRRQESVHQLLRELDIKIFNQRVWSASELIGVKNKKQTLMSKIICEFDNPVSVAYVGDAIDDLKAALGCNLISIYINKEYSKTNWEALGVSPHFCFKNIYELTQFLVGEKNVLSTR